MPMTGAQRIEKYRQRQKARVAEVERDLAECRQERAQRLRQVFDLDEQVTNLQKSNKRVWTMYKNEQALVRALRASYGEEDAAVLDWDKLKAMSPKQLQAWVKVGSAMSSKDHDDPAGNAVKWVEGNLRVDG